MRGDGTTKTVSTPGNHQDCFGFSDIVHRPSSVITHHASRITIVYPLSSIPHSTFRTPQSKKPLSERPTLARDGPNPPLVGLGVAPRFAGCRVGLRASSLPTSLDFYAVVALNLQNLADSVKFPT